MHRPIYEATATRWQHTSTYKAYDPDSQVRWVNELPGPPLRYRWQTAAFLAYLAGREVRNTFNSIYAFFYFILGRDGSAGCAVRAGFTSPIHRPGPPARSPGDRSVGPVPAGLAASCATRRQRSNPWRCPTPNR